MDPYRQLVCLDRRYSPILPSLPINRIVGAHTIVLLSDLSRFDLAEILFCFEISIICALMTFAAAMENIGVWFQVLGDCPRIHRTLFSSVFRVASRSICLIIPQKPLHSQGTVLFQEVV